MRFTLRSINLLLLLVAFTNIGKANMPDEGMFPLSDIKKMDLKKIGFNIGPEELYNPNGSSIVEALVNIGGCTGSFVSDKGLIITNHHCSFGAVQLASTADKDYITDGYIASTPELEIEAKGLTCRITESYEDVSARVLASASSIVDPTERIKAIQANMAAIVKEEEAKDNTIKAEVSEMFIGKSYVLFRYKTIQDVRLVYVPRRTIGEYGGQTDNWVWPRHTGDFSFVRAYVSPDGKPAAYSKNNVPYKPKRYLRVNANGINEEEFVFALGYPGRTFRHRPAQYLEYQKNFLLPYVSNLYEWQNEQMGQASEEAKEYEVRLASRMQRNANVLKNYRGKIQGLNRIPLIDEKREEEKKIQAFIDSDPQLKARYGTLLKDIDAIYREIFSDALRDLWFTQLFPSTVLLNIGNSIYALKLKLKELPEDKRGAYVEENRNKIKASVDQLYSSYVEMIDKRLLRKMFSDALALSSTQSVQFVDNHFAQMMKGGEKTIDAYIDKLFSSTKLKSKDFAIGILYKTPAEIIKESDEMFTMLDEFYLQYRTVLQTRQTREGRLNKLMADYVDVKNNWKKTDFVPDANSTMRITYGRVRGYSPADAVYNGPFTTLRGVIEKGNTAADFEMPMSLKELYDKRDFGQFAHPKLKDVPVAFLYNLDTSGGSSGSPVMNASGELIGVNFDRAYSATINDFAWNEAYSRSIGVDIRYVLWVAQKVDKADFILTELGIPLVK